ncbi:ABC transporter permease [Flavitalea sp. BT771]|uniref:ABC transporter permease n=1 Tax=Flavitalea sp. BT771 TaxID=3063329 RepID=UPI0026E17EBB|nr:ABC transporter permease [Flavitalea sp. BT771]MDO6428991.1 ABC transporter permease [Flavitalea sp. BT771]MDV6218881.1 ABC transporter permease [Flavitalea sp. BT771]
MAWTKFITAISKEANHMEKLLSTPAPAQAAKLPLHPFWVIVSKEMSDHVRSWRFIILLSLILLTCAGSLYTALNNIGTPSKTGSPVNGTFFFLQLFTATDGSLPSFIVFINFLGPLLGIAMGFDAVNSEFNRGTLSRIMAQPVHRDYLLNGKFVASLLVVGILFFSLTLLVTGLGLVFIGIPPTASEFLRILSFSLLSILYVAFWLNLSILFSIRFRQPATSALTSIAAWLFLTIFYPILIRLVAKLLAPDAGSFPGPGDEPYSYQHTLLKLLRFAPSQLFSDATTTLLMPSIRSLGPLTMEQVAGAIPNPLPLGESVLIVWPQLTGLVAATVLCFALSYVSFMRKEIRSR